MEIHYVVAIDLTPAVDDTGTIDDHTARRIIHNSSDFPDGATVRLNIGTARFCGSLGTVLEHAGKVEITGSDAGGLRRVGIILSGGGPFDRLI